MLNKILVLLLFVFLFCAALPAWSYQPETSGTRSALPPPVIPYSVGVNIHFVTGHARDLDLIESAGFRFIRMDFRWAETERIKGVYDWSAYDELTANLERRRIRAIYILDYNNPLYTDRGVNFGPDDSADVAAYASWAAAAVRHFKGRHIVWEIWNEPNNRAFWKPHPDVNHYIALALSACKAIRKADPGATIIAPGAVRFQWSFLKPFLKSGVLRYIDGVSVHPYRGIHPPETVALQFRRLQKLVARYEPRGGNIPVISSEWGYTTYSKGVSYKTQADYLVRQQLFNLYCGVPLSIWYDWKNDGPNISVKGENRGVVTNNLKRKPSYFAIRTLTHELSGFHITRRYDTGDSADFVLTLMNAEGSSRIVGWTTGSAHTVRLPLSLLVLNHNPATITCVGEEGHLVTIKASDKSVSCRLTGAPEYLIP